MGYKEKQHNRAYGNGSLRNRVFVEYKCYATSGEVEKTVKSALF